MKKKYIAFIDVREERKTYNFYRIFMCMRCRLLMYYKNIA